MQISNIPVKFPIPWGNSAGSGYIRTIPTASQIGIQGGAASLTDGYPPLCMLLEAAGGIPPFGQDQNGILKQITQWNQWQQAGGPVAYDSAFSTAIGGYPKGCVLSSATLGGFWLSTVDNNTSNPDTGGANWQSLFLGLATTAALAAEASTRATEDTSLQNQISALFGTVNDRTSSRALGFTYTNTSGRPVMVCVIGITTGNFANLILQIDGNLVAEFGQYGTGSELYVNGIVPVGSTYESYNTVSGVSMQKWIEIV